jgi:hypothetical protein
VLECVDKYRGKDTSTTGDTGTFEDV